ncbi:MAG: 2-dehydropantoate 2-reductase [Lachnospiraceae bacterium]|nr:2-dehydropantoate 2-reductase [Lachnospiraceae bacterium]
MKIAVIGPGAMGLLYGAKLSQCADVVLVGNNPEHIREIQENGVTIKREGMENKYQVKAVLNGEIRDPADLILLFTKAYLTEEVLSLNRAMIGPKTMLLTLQNGAGHEEILRRFADEDRVLIGTTAQGSYRENAHVIVNSGLGDTVIGKGGGKGEEPAAESKRESAGNGGTGRLQEIADCFVRAGFPCAISDNIRQTVWNKLMINASSSVLSGVLQRPQGYVAENGWAWEICQDLIREICETANGEGCAFDEKEQIARIQTHLQNAPGGYTSIYADLKNGRKTEVDVISGAVVRAAAKQGRPVPAQTMMVRLVHAMEQENGFAAS